MSSPVDLQAYRERRDALATYDPRAIPDYTLSVSDDPAERALDAARAAHAVARHAVHGLHTAFLDSACALTQADCAALKEAHRAWVTAAAALDAAQAACALTYDTAAQIPF